MPEPSASLDVVPLTRTSSGVPRSGPGSAESGFVGMAGDRRPVVVVAEDEGSLLEIEVEFLADEGFEVIGARDGDEASGVLRSRPDVDLLITDVNMPGELDGIALARLARELDGGVGIIVVSGKLRDTGALPSGARFMAKPFAMQAMVDEAKRVLGMAGR